MCRDSNSLMPLWKPQPTPEQKQEAHRFLIYNLYTAFWEYTTFGGPFSLPCDLKAIHWHKEITCTQLRPIGSRFALRPAVFKMQACWKSKMHRTTQNDLNQLTVRSTLYTLNTHPRSPNFAPCRSTTNPFWDTSLSKNGNAPNNAIMILIT